MDNMPTMSKKMFRVKEVRGGLTSFQTLLKVHEGLSVVFFWAEWADQCAPLDEAFKLLSKDKDLESVQFLKVDSEREEDITSEYSVEAVPNFLIFAPGGNAVLEQIEGAKVSHVVKVIKDLATQVANEQEKRALKELSCSPKSSDEDDLMMGVKSVSSSPSRGAVTVRFVRFVDEDDNEEDQKQRMAVLLARRRSSAADSATRISRQQQQQ